MLISRSVCNKNKHLMLAPLATMLHTSLSISAILCKSHFWPQTKSLQFSQLYLTSYKIIGKTWLVFLVELSGILISFFSHQFRCLGDEHSTWPIYSLQ